jgi:hypothetical protein
MPNPIRPWPARPVETWQSAVFARARDNRNGYLTAILAVVEKERTTTSCGYFNRRKAYCSFKFLTSTMKDLRHGHSSHAWNILFVEWLKRHYHKALASISCPKIIQPICDKDSDWVESFIRQVEDQPACSCGLVWAKAKTTSIPLKCREPPYKAEAKAALEKEFRLVEGQNKYYVR